MGALSQLIHRSVGPSGKNKVGPSYFQLFNIKILSTNSQQDYLYELAAAIKHLSSASSDPYLEALEARVRALDSLDTQLEDSIALETIS